MVYEQARMIFKTELSVDAIVTLTVVRWRGYYAIHLDSRADQPLQRVFYIPLHYDGLLVSVVRVPEQVRILESFTRDGLRVQRAIRRSVFKTAIPAD